MLVKEDVSLVLEAMAYYAKHAMRDRDKKNVWRVYFKIKEEFGLSEKKRVHRKFRWLIYLSALLAGFLVAYLWSRLF